MTTAVSGPDHQDLEHRPPEQEGRCDPRSGEEPKELANHCPNWLQYMAGPLPPSIEALCRCNSLLCRRAARAWNDL